MVALAACACLLGFVPQDMSPYPVNETDFISAKEHGERRKRVLELMPKGSVAVLFTNPERNRSNDTDFRFRPNSDFWYLTGCMEPDSVLVLSQTGIVVDGQVTQEVLFVNDRKPSEEIWTGIRMGPLRAGGLLGFQVVQSNTRLKAFLETLRPTSVAKLDLPEGPARKLARLIDDVKGWMPKFTVSPSLTPIIGKLRTTKSPAELGLIQKAIDATVLAHIEALKSCEPGMREYDIAALVEYIFARNGCEAVAYGSIVGSGANSCTLHYVDNRKVIGRSDIICMDVGGEYHGYAADVTRSYPANGKFSPEQRAIYELVLEAQTRGIEACVAGAPFNSSNKATTSVIGKGLMKLGITKELSESRKYFMHGSSHFIGLDVHDPQMADTFAPNQVVTVEPGVYIAPGSPCDKKWWNIGIRIEDDILITTKGPKNLSGKLPNSIAAIEALMKQRGIGNLPTGNLAALLRSVPKVERISHNHGVHHDHHAEFDHELARAVGRKSK